MLPDIARFLLSDNPRLRLLMGYWSGSALLYMLSMGLLYLQVRAGTAAAEGSAALCWFALCGVLFFFVLVRVSTLLRITPRQLAVMQAVFAILCTVGAYAVTGPIRGATLMVLLVVIVFCAFSLRPRDTLGLTAFALASLGLTMAALVRRAPAMHPVHDELMHFAICGATLLAVAILTGEMSKLRAKMNGQKEELLAAMGKIQTLATIDELTSLANRRHMNEVLTSVERRQNDSGETICLALLDIDFFKRVNDSCGHAGGDAVLRNFALAASAQLRAGDMLARWGGEEFLMLLPDAGLEEAAQVLARMAAAVGAIALPELQQRGITFSAGLVQRAAGEAFAETISRADKALYEAKATGRNRVVAA